MRDILVFATVLVAIPSTFAGVGVVTPQVEDEAARLWNRWCQNGQGGQNGDVSVHCKISNDIIEQPESHVIEVTPRPSRSQQVVFIRPPTYRYNHDITVTGGGSSGQKTVIYVLPSRNTNDVQLRDETSNQVVQQKPTIYFLKKDHGDQGSSSGAGSGSRRPAAPPPSRRTRPPRQPEPLSAKTQESLQNEAAEQSILSKIASPRSKYVLAIVPRPENFPV